MLALSNRLTALLVSALAVSVVRAEQHIVTFDNRCGYGTPVLKIGQDPTVYNGAVISYGPIIGAIAFLQTGGCGANGESCTLVEFTLQNGFSAADISLVWPHTFSVTSGFGYYSGCDGAGYDCTNPNCCCKETGKTDIIGCANSDVNIAITFCD